MARIVTDQKTRVVSAPVAIIVAILSAGYMLPWAIAAVRGSRNAWSVFWVNLLLGWTVIGWIIALVMSIREHRILEVR
ncbi:superinfection immunity protein [Janibacter hoylei]|uniref:superinfection immunity protein n=1 Tax=Janibacter hoylei TaxID=364298 RepID=UPI00248FA8CA|nr:superinfection immunity protein [Janibacter hoylei]